ncbi:MAG: DUF2254 domain-containing protein [Rhodospirillales bacterium]
MRLLLVRLSGAIFGSYWFIPGMMTVLAAGLAVLGIWVDRVWQDAWPITVNWLLISQPDGARALLQAIAGSMVTVAGVTFSITIATVSQATNQFGPRLMTNFLQDLGNQITLGAFIATFVFCLIVLRTVTGSSNGENIFVPNVSIGVAMVLAIASLAVLIYFFQHVPDSVHISMMVSAVGLRMHAMIDELYPESVGEAGEEDPREEARAGSEGMLEDAAPIYATVCGYVGHIDPRALMETARQMDVVIWVSARPGDFVDPKVPLAFVKPSAHVDDRTRKQVRAGYIVGRKRTETQDLLFLVDQLAEVAGKALSPGINDPVTAMTCVDWLTSGLIQFAGRPVPSACRHDENGVLRVVAQPVTFAEFAEAALAQVRPYVETDRNAAIHMMDSMARLAHHLRDGMQARIVRSCAEALMDGCERELSHPADRQAVAGRLTFVCHRLLPHLGPDPAPA